MLVKDQTSNAVENKRGRIGQVALDKKCHPIVAYTTLGCTPRLRATATANGDGPIDSWTPGCQDSSKRGAVETGCSDLYDVIY